MPIFIPSSKQAHVNNSTLISASQQPHPSLSMHALHQSALRTCPALVGPYLRSISAEVLQARPSYQLLQTYSLLSFVLREAPVSLVVDKGRPAAPAWRHGYETGSGVEAFILGGRGRSGGEVLLATVIPLALSKKELTKGVLSANSLLQVTSTQEHRCLLSSGHRDGVLPTERCISDPL